MQIIYKKINEIKPYIRNPRKNDKTVDKLVAIIPKVGFNVPIVIDKKGIIVKGHARFKAAIKLGMEEVPCIITDADEEAIKLDRISDNKISEFSEWISDELLHELDMITEDISILGFKVPTLDDSFGDMFKEFEENMKIENDDKVDQVYSSSEESEEEKRKRYEEFLRQQEEENKTEISFVDQSKLDKAKEKTKDLGNDGMKYYKVVCEKCGHTMFVSKNAYWKFED